MKIAAPIVILLGCVAAGCGSSTPLSVIPGDAGKLDASVVDGFDAGAGPPSFCIIEERSTLPHVHFALRAPTCIFTLVEAAQGITIPYDLVVARNVEGFASLPAPVDPVVANLRIHEELSGNGQHYCYCDIGSSSETCPMGDGGVYDPPGPSCAPLTIPAGVYSQGFRWNGRNWNGPSDTRNSYGPSFPAGDYALKISTTEGAIGDQRGLGVSVTMLVRLVP
jgi:hypothetical protein